jgi:ectoine hydroxylase-related dioxygenase (phytanoyl-CoA dioxygenase family)
MPTTEAVKHYNNEGFCVLRNVIFKKKLFAVLYEMDAIFANMLLANNIPPTTFTGDESIYLNMRSLFEKDPQLYLAAARHISKLASLQNLVSCEEILTAAGKFAIQHPSIPSSPVLHISSEKLRIPGGYYGVSPHQDWTSIQGGLGSIVMWIPFMDIHHSRFPLELIPKSHKQGLWKGKIEEHTFSIDPSLYEAKDFVRKELNLGDILVMSVFTVHRTALENCSGLRIASSTRYENANEPSFVSRGYPCAYKRTVQREFITPNFPSQERVMAMFGDNEKRQKIDELEK